MQRSVRYEPDLDGSTGPARRGHPVDRAPGEELIITENDQPVAKLVATAAPQESCVPRPARRRPGPGHAPDFDAPLDDFKEYME